MRIRVVFIAWRYASTALLPLPSAMAAATMGTSAAPNASDMLWHMATKFHGTL